MTPMLNSAMRGTSKAAAKGRRVECLKLATTLGSAVCAVVSRGASTATVTPSPKWVGAQFSRREPAQTLPLTRTRNELPMAPSRTMSAYRGSDLSTAFPARLRSCASDMTLK